MASRGAPIARPEVQERTLWKRLRWYEAALWLPERQLLIAPEALGTAGYYRVDGERLSVHPLLRMWPPRLSLVGLPPGRDQRRPWPTADRERRRRAAGGAAHLPAAAAEGVGARLPHDARRASLLRVARLDGFDALALRRDASNGGRRAKWRRPQCQVARCRAAPTRASSQARRAGQPMRIEFTKTTLPAARSVTR